MSFRTSRRVEFRDTDAAGIVHFSAFFPMMEAAEHQMLRELGIAVMPRHVDGVAPLTWPRVSASCDYRSAARFEDLLDIEVCVAKIGSSSVQYGFTFRCQDRLLAVGRLAAVCCRLTASGTLTKEAIPDDIRGLLQRYSGEHGP